MALPHLSIFETPKGALLWVRGRIYCDQLGRNLPLSLALGGILQLCSRQYFLPDAWSILSLISWPLSVLGVPIIVSLLISNEKRVCEIRRITRRKSKIALLYFIYQARKAVKSIRKDVVSLDSDLKKYWNSKNGKKITRSLDKMECHRCVASTIEYTQFLSNALYDYFRFSSSFHFLEHMHINGSILARDVEIFISGVRRILWAQERGEADEQATEEAQLSLLSILSCLEEIESFTDPDFAWEIVQIATTHGANRAITTFIDCLFWLRHTKSEKVATRFAQIANESRGFPLRILADLNDGVNQSIFPLPSHGKYRADAQKYVADNFRSFLEDLICLIGTSQISVATIGFSSTILACLKNSSDLVDSVYVLQCDPRTILADHEMCEKVMSLGLRVELIDGASSGCYTSVNASLVMFGFEVLSTNGDFLHRRSLEVIARTVVSSLFSTYEKVVAVGETWKVREFNPSFRSHRLTEAIRCKAGLTIITDCGTHDIVSDNQLNFRCCMLHWEHTVRKIGLNSR